MARDTEFLKIFIALYSTRDGDTTDMLFEEDDDVAGVGGTAIVYVFSLVSTM